jgi:hypothetical protein
VARNEAPSPAGLAHHYAHVAVALIESRKGANCGEEATNAIENTIKGVCGLIDALVTQEHKDISRNGGTHQ